MQDARCGQGADHEKGDSVQGRVHSGELGLLAQVLLPSQPRRTEPDDKGTAGTSTPFSIVNRAEHQTEVLFNLKRC